MNCLNTTIYFFVFSVQTKNLTYEHSFPIKKQISAGILKYICCPVIRANMSMNGNESVFQNSRKFVRIVI